MEHVARREVVAITQFTDASTRDATSKVVIGLIAQIWRSIKRQAIVQDVGEAFIKGTSKGMVCRITGY